MDKITEIAIISGKGGVGKTSISACFASLLTNLVIADCDVDASNLRLLVDGEKKDTSIFKSGFILEINKEKCVKCGLCYENCAFCAIKKDSDNNFFIDEILCEGCSLCYQLCKKKAIDRTPAVCGEIDTLKIKNGFLIDANLKTGAENSGKLVSEVRKTALNIAKENHINTVIIDGPPGIGCPAIASITGIHKVVIITEASLSGYHDFMRALKLASHFKIKTYVCVNKWDINKEITEKIENHAIENGAIILPKIPYDKDFKRNLLDGKTILSSHTKTGEIVEKIIKIIINNEYKEN